MGTVDVDDYKDGEGTLLIQMFLDLLCIDSPNSCWPTSSLFLTDRVIVDEASDASS